MKPQDNKSAIQTWCCPVQATFGNFSPPCPVISNFYELEITPGTRWMEYNEYQRPNISVPMAPEEERSQTKAPG